MRYIGGKESIADWVCETLLTQRSRTETYLEPFLGSAAIFSKIAPHYSRAIGADAHPDLMLMWKAVQEGWLPPHWVGKSTHAKFKNEPPSALRGAIGFGASFRGKWFGAYSEHPGGNRNPTMAVFRKCLEETAPTLRGAELVHASYEAHCPGKGWLVYCDPPYYGTTGYATGRFDHPAFYKTLEEWVSSGAIVLVSESQMPRGYWVPIRVRGKREFLKPGEALKYRVEALWVPKRQKLLWPNFEDA